MLFEDWLLMEEAVAEELSKPFNELEYKEIDGLYLSIETIEELQKYHGLKDDDIRQIVKDIKENDLGGGEMKKMQLL